MLTLRVGEMDQIIETVLNQTYFMLFMFHVKVGVRLSRTTRAAMSFR